MNVKKTSFIRKRSFKMIWRRHPESDRGMRVLQTPALPLGYGAVSIYLVYGKRDFV